jgi:hypothetical protein
MAMSEKSFLVYDEQAGAKCKQYLLLLEFLLFDLVVDLVVD